MDILLDKDGDLYIGPDGDIEIKDAVAQDIRVQLKWFLGEWRWNRELGVPYWDKVFVKDPDLPAIEAEIREQIFNVTKVTSVRSVSVELDPVTRAAIIRYVAETDLETIRGEAKIQWLITE